MPEAEHILDGRFKPLIAVASGVRLITSHDARPLVAAHCPGSAISQQVDDDAIRWQFEQVVTRIAEKLLSLLSSRHVDRLNGLDAKWLNNGLHVTSLHYGA